MISWLTLPVLATAVLLSCSLATPVLAFSSEELVELSAEAAVALLCSRQVTAVQYAQALLERANNYSCINAFASLPAEKILADASAVDAKASAGEYVGPLCGLAFSVKDNIDVAGYETVAGTVALEGNFPKHNCPLIDRLQAAHGVVFGKARMHELAAGVDSINPLYGPVLNPFNLTMHVGGSSGGTGAIVAARIAPAGFCSDTGGSCRIPGSVTGTVGFRPTTGCYSAGDGIVPLSVTRDTVGTMARHVGDIILFDKIFSDCPRVYPEVSLKGLKVGFPKTPWWEDIGEEAVATFEAALEAMEGAGVELVEVDVSLLVDAYNEEMPDFFFYRMEVNRELSRYLVSHNLNVSLTDLISKIATPSVKQFYEAFTAWPLTQYPSPKDYQKAFSTVLPKLTALWHSYYDTFGFDVMVVPTTPIPARPIYDVLPYTEINGRRELQYNVYGRTHKADPPSAIPGLSIPIGPTSYHNMPIGIQLHTRSGDDGLLLAVGKVLQPLFATNPPPPKRPLCHGCTPLVKAVAVGGAAYSGHGTLPRGSQYKLDMDGECELKQTISFPVAPPPQGLVQGPDLLAKVSTIELGAQKACKAYLE